MDPFSSEVELVDLRDHFAAGRFQEVVDYDTSSLSEENKLPAHVLALRAKIALGDAAEALEEIKDAESAPEYQAVKAYAEHATGKTADALKVAEELAASAGDNATVQLLAGSVLQSEGKTEEALALLSQHQGNLEAVALIVQIHLQQNRTDLALKEVLAAKKWAQDNLLINIAESWVALRVGGEKYQEAFYVFEEIAQAPSGAATLALLSQAVSEIHLGRFEEAEAALSQAIKQFPDNADVIANMAVLSILSGKDRSEYVQSLQKLDPEHPYIKGVEEKSDLFDKAASNRLEIAWRSPILAQSRREFGKSVSYRLQEGAKNVGASSALRLMLLTSRRSFKSKGLQPRSYTTTFITKKHQLQNTSNCKVTKESLLAVSIWSGNFVDAIVNNADQKAKDFITAYAKDYLDNLKSAHGEDVGLNSRPPDPAALSYRLHDRSPSSLSPWSSNGG
ncbi:hypothetical protein O988_07125 [Pseudogymnoascus sp. VKM F-3808]|nr:hypothetical protein O988_07125 [Pseudogymnoascus sp. VKM F-3808]